MVITTKIIYNWELTVKLIERAKLTDLFDGKDPNYKEITFFAPPSYSILRYLWDNDMESVEEMTIEECKNIVLRHVLDKKYLKNHFAYRNVDYMIDDELQDGGTNVTTMGEISYAFIETNPPMEVFPMSVLKPCIYIP